MTSAQTVATRSSEKHAFRDTHGCGTNKHAPRLLATESPLVSIPDQTVVVTVAEREYFTRCAYLITPVRQVGAKIDNPSDPRRRYLFPRTEPVCRRLGIKAGCPAKDSGNTSARPVFSGVGGCTYLSTFGPTPKYAAVCSRDVL
ncbi:Hypp2638 [Branchiostoma lanceolatum]|uniref:Hypp2638 protein n=1 Tax=Branchiostoma lanceolatum TaxID=7740 RepID=A0A8J9ZTL6_BRALA|nr:Hypp2638 [Branchiostoma lanceolatum]